MGADWVKFKVRPDADLQDVCDLATFVSEQYPHGRWIVPPAGLATDEATRERWQRAVECLESQLIFAKGELDYFSHTALTDPPGNNLDVVFGGEKRIAPQLHDVDACRVYVISHNPVFPTEWRDEAYRIILPTELLHYYNKWRVYIEEVRTGSWRSYLHDLYLFDRVTDEHQQEQFEDLVRFARGSITRTNAWCRKEGLAGIRERILEFNAFERLKRIREATPRPRFDQAVRDNPVTTEQAQTGAAYWELRETAAGQIKDWNRLVPRKWKVQFPVKTAFSDFLSGADCAWLKNFFAWCEALLDEEYGLYLSA